MSTHLPADYPALLADIKQRVRHAQTRAMLAVNAELIRLYWDIGALIDQRQKREGWGAAVIPRLAKDLHNELPEEKGFSERNIKRMLAFYREYPSLAATAGSTEKVPQAVAQLAPGEKVPQAVAQSRQAPGGAADGAQVFAADVLLSLPWGHHAELIAKVKEPGARHWYMCAAIENGWSRSVLLMQIETAAHLRQGRAASNFALRLPPPDSDLVQQTLKDPYLFDFLNFYCNVVDDRLRHATDQPTIGLILCQKPNHVLAEYALRGVDKPIGVSGFELTRALPETLQSSLPSIEQIERELGGGHE